MSVSDHSKDDPTIKNEDKAEINAHEDLKIGNQSGGISVGENNISGGEQSIIIKGGVEESVLITGDKNEVNIYPQPQSSKGKPYQRDRKSLLAKINTNWIGGYLNHFVHDKHFITLNMEIESGVEQQTWNTTLLQTKESISNEQIIVSIFEQCGRSLLILGAQASGKTITLIQLAKGLLDKANKEPNAPIPIIVNLSSWEEKRQSLKKWLIDVLVSEYQLPHKLASTWLEQNLFVFLLDNFDKVLQIHRKECAIAINDFVGTADTKKEIVVCSHEDEYKRHRKSLNLGAIVRILPLTNDQINQYLSNLNIVQNLVREQDSWLDLLQSPAILNLTPSSFNDITLEQITSTIFVKQKRHSLFDEYIEREFKHRLSSNIFYTSKAAKHWLINLAQSMRANGKSIFRIEELNLNWLPESGHVWFELIKGIIIWVIIGLLGGLIYGPIAGVRHVSETLVEGLVICGPFLWVIIGIYFLKESKLLPSKEEINNAPVSAIGRILLIWESVWLIALFFFGVLSSGQLDTEPIRGFIEILFNGFILELFLGIISGFVSWLLLGPLLGLCGWLLSWIIPALFLLPLGVFYNDGEDRGATVLGKKLSPRMRKFITPSAIALDVVFEKYEKFTYFQHYLLPFFLYNFNILPSFRRKELNFFFEEMQQRNILRFKDNGWAFLHPFLLEYFADQHPRHKRLQNKDLSNADLYSEDLRWIQLQGAYLKKANLSRADLREAILVEANLEETILDRANLKNADIESANLKLAKLESANLQEADLNGANFQQANLEHADLTKANLQDANLIEANLQHATLRQANLLRANLTSANFEDVNFEMANLQSANLRCANLQKSHLWSAKLQEADLRKATLQDSSLSLAKLQGADLQNANFQGADMQFTNLEGANLQGAILGASVLEETTKWFWFNETKQKKPADLRRANLRGANLRGANLCMVDLTQTILHGIDISQTDLRGAILPISTLSEADERGMKYDSKTRWPSFFDAH